MTNKTTPDDWLLEILGDYGAERARAYRDMGDNPPYSTTAENLKREAVAAINAKITELLVEERIEAITQAYNAIDNTEHTFF